VPSGAADPPGQWLDQPLAAWNTPGADIPTPPDVSPLDPNNPMCASTVRPPETPADTAVADQGWKLVGPYEGGWGVMVVMGTAGFDGMCRAMGYQVFVFVDGAYAGTISPEPMFARTTGAGRLQGLGAGDAMTASFVRYVESDPLCCPSRPAATVNFRVDRSESGPVLTPVSLSAN
jgi:hypothetical protein